MTGDTVESSAAVDGRGNVYFGSHDGNVYALSNIGKILWLFNTGHAIYSSPAISINGILYVGSDDSNIYALQMLTGFPVWAIKTSGPIRSSPSLGEFSILNLLAKKYVADSNLAKIHQEMMGHYSSDPAMRQYMQLVM